MTSTAKNTQGWCFATFKSYSYITDSCFWHIPPGTCNNSLIETVFIACEVISQRNYAKKQTVIAPLRVAGKRSPTLQVWVPRFPTESSTPCVMTETSQCQWKQLKVTSTLHFRLVRGAANTSQQSEEHRAAGPRFTLSLSLMVPCHYITGLQLASAPLLPLLSELTVTTATEDHIMPLPSTQVKYHPRLPILVDRCSSSHPFQRIWPLIYTYITYITPLYIFPKCLVDLTVSHFVK